ncbi:hypothetical protein CAMSH0001_0826 [Campylobacter showae RM3277]|uniref:Uncharacterized protein n=1 Tax=Campylobacter showae RM3277 TaxID=553219 RepID=C6RHJ9_9BACT|nr:hypothetical protein CAMSH0001_0826 [Campylobacter showae RM3277]
MGAESQFYGYSGDDKPAPADSLSSAASTRKTACGVSYRLLFGRERRKRLVLAQ